MFIIHIYYNSRQVQDNSNISKIKVQIIDCTNTTNHPLLKVGIHTEV